jgi:formylmethanofuran dehydrogenase subunit D
MSRRFEISRQLTKIEVVRLVVPSTGGSAMSRYKNAPSRLEEVKENTAASSSSSG